MLLKYAKNMIIYGFASGFCVGCVPNECTIQVQDKKYTRIPVPLITGLVCSMGSICSPLLLMNYMCNGVYLDKWVDKYDIQFERFHQYDGNHNKYAFPSYIILHIRDNDKNKEKE